MPALGSVWSLIAQTYEFVCDAVTLSVCDAKQSFCNLREKMTEQFNRKIQKASVMKTNLHEVPAVVLMEAPL